MAEEEGGLVLNLINEAPASVNDGGGRRKRKRELERLPPSLQKVERLLRGDKQPITPSKRTKHTSTSPSDGQTTSSARTAVPDGKKEAQGRAAHATKPPLRKRNFAAQPTTANKATRATTSGEPNHGPALSATSDRHEQPPFTSNKGKAAAQDESLPSTRVREIQRKGSRKAISFTPFEYKETDFFSSNTFEAMNLSPTLIQHLAQRMNMSKPTHIQSAAIPHMLQGRDVLVKAHTGSGKTLTYLLPIVQSLQARDPRLQRSDGTYAIIAAPTRELALQIFQVLQQVLRPFYWIVPGCIMGGEKKKSEKARIRKGISILVGTPGRLADHLENTASFNLAPLEFLVLDEADRLLDMGFEKEIRRIVRTVDERRTSSHRQTALISATLTPAIKELATIMLDEQPIFVSTSASVFGEPSNSKTESTSSSTPAPTATPIPSTALPTDDLITTPKGLTQSFVIVPCKKRLVTLAAFLRFQTNLQRLKQNVDNPQHCKVIVFMSNIASVEFHHTLLSRTFISPSGDLSQPTKVDEAGDDKTPEPFLQVPLFKLHGDLTQVERTDIYFGFCRAESAVLFCTDVAARGLDLPAVNWIIQYDPPDEPTEYIHRVGRTARIGHQGHAMLFLLPSEEKYVDLLENDYKLQLRKISMSSILKTLPSDGTAADDFQPAQDLHLHFERLIKKERESKDGTLHRQAAGAYRSFVRAYATHSSATKHIFHIKNLHLGHVAKSFGLSDPPSRLGAAGAKQAKLQKKKQGKGASTGRKAKGWWDEAGPANDQQKQKKMQVPLRKVQQSEFDAGI
ncbi:ATP-dependent RNA helicase [Balamuthia mandrillaris]